MSASTSNAASEIEPLPSSPLSSASSTYTAHSDPTSRGNRFSAYGPMKKPTAIELIRLISGPRVDIYVGPNKKHYFVPKDLLCYHSPYFDRCFNGSFREAQEQKLELSEDSVEDFEILLDCLVRRTMDVKPGLVGSDETVSECLAFIKYADKYGLGDISEIVLKPLREALSIHTTELLTRKAARGSSPFERPLRQLQLQLSALSAQIQPNQQVQQPQQEQPAPVLKRPNGIETKDIELVFDICPPGNPLRTVMAQAVLAENGGLNGLHNIQEKADHIEGFAAELIFVISKLKQPQHSYTTQSWFDEIKRF